MVDTVKLWPNTQVISCEEQSNGDLVVELNDDASLTIDYNILATGYTVRINVVPFLAQGNTSNKLKTRKGFPVLDDYLQTNIPGLFITSIAAAQDFGSFFAFTIAVRISARLIGKALVN